MWSSGLTLARNFYQAGFEDHFAADLEWLGVLEAVFLAMISAGEVDSAIIVAIPDLQNAVQPAKPMGRQGLGFHTV
jgi:hypothetical protein